VAKTEIITDGAPETQKEPENPHQRAVRELRERFPRLSEEMAESWAFLYNLEDAQREETEALSSSPQSATLLRLHEIISEPADVDFYQNEVRNLLNQLEIKGENEKVRQSLQAACQRSLEIAFQSSHGLRNVKLLVELFGISQSKEVEPLVNFEATIIEGLLHLIRSGQLAAAETVSGDIARLKFKGYHSTISRDKLQNLPGFREAFLEGFKRTLQNNAEFGCYAYIVKAGQLGIDLREIARNTETTININALILGL